MHTTETASAAEPAWAGLHRALAHALVGLRGDQEELMDRLSYALEESCTQFPIMEAGEELSGIDPFTVFASFARPMPDHRRRRVLELLCDALQVDAPVPGEFADYPVVRDYQARFFSHSTRPGQQQREIESLWNAFEAALAFAEGAASREDVEAARAQVQVQRAPGAKVMGEALAWLAPGAFLPLARTQEAAFSLDPAAVDGFLDAYGAFAASPEAETVRHPNLWQAAACFARAWDADAEDFSAMVRAALDGHDGLLHAGYYYNPYREMCVFAQKEPEATRAAFSQLFSQNRPLEERIVLFERSTAELFERHRIDIVSTTPRRSSHGNWHAVSTYVFLHDPASAYLFSPSSIRALDAACASACHYRIANPECVSLYDALCDALLAYVKSKRPDVCELAEPLAAVHVGPDCQGVLSPQAEEHLLVEDMVAFARRRAAGKAAP